MYMNQIFNVNKTRLIVHYYIKNPQKKVQNTAFGIATGCTQDKCIQYLQDKTKVLLMNTYLKLHAIKLKQLTQTQVHFLHDLNAYSDPLKNMKATIFHNNEHTNITISEPDITLEECVENLKQTHIGSFHAK